MVGLADIFLLRAPCIEDLRKGVGWTEDEAIEFHKTGIVPDRIFGLTGDRTAEDLIGPPTHQRERKKGISK